MRCGLHRLHLIQSRETPGSICKETGLPSLPSDRADRGRGQEDVTEMPTEVK